MAPRKKILPHLDNRAPRFPEDHAKSGGKDGRGRLRRALSGAVLLVALFAAYPLLHRPDVSQPRDSLAHVTDCDRLAAHPRDIDKLAPGVPEDQLDVAKSMRACTTALKRQPHDGRTLYQLGRAEIAAKDGRAGVDHLRQSAAAGYAQGGFALGLILGNSDSIAPDVCEAGRLWANAARQRHLYARIALANAWRDGLIRDCALPTSESEIAALLAGAGELVETPEEQRDLDAARTKWGG